jgi:hypothetical protein
MALFHFDFAVRPTVVRADRERLKVGELDNRGLRRIARGKIFLTIDKPRDFIVIESEVLDYLIQLKGAIEHIDAGTHQTFTVSGDHFSNNLRFTYDPSSKRLEIYEANGGMFKLDVPYREFRTSLLAFYRDALSDLQLLYPELTSNKEYCSLLGKPC